MACDDISKCAMLDRVEIVRIKCFSREIMQRSDKWIRKCDFNVRNIDALGNAGTAK